VVRGPFQQDSGAEISGIEHPVASRSRVLRINPAIPSWFSATAGATIEVVSEDLRDLPNLHFAWFAQSDGADGPCWSGGNDGSYPIPHNAAFVQCYDDDSGCNAVYPFIRGQFSPEWVGFTVMLLAPGVAGRANQGCVWGSPLFTPDPPPPPPVTTVTNNNHASTFMEM